RRLVADGVSADQICCPAAQLEIRLRGQESALTIDWSDPPERLAHGPRLVTKPATPEAPSPCGCAGHSTVAEKQPADTFIRQFVSIFGYTPDTSKLELLSIRVRAQGSEKPAQKEEFPETHYLSPVNHTTLQYIRRETLRPGDVFAGPAVILDPFSTTVVEPS